MELSRISMSVVGLIGSQLLAAPALAQSPEPPSAWPTCRDGEIEVVLLGVFHMEGSRDDFQRDVDNVLSERRQSEMPDVVAWLTAMRPDRIGVEVPWSDQSSLSAAYGEYRRGERELSASEVDQLGFRTAEALGHDDVYAIDYRLGIGNDSIAAFYERHPDQQARNRPIMLDVARASGTDGRRLAGSTLVDYLHWQNGEEALREEGNRAMYAHLIAGEDGNYGGADLYTRWYERNIKMAHHVSRIAIPTDKRVLVIVGSGHVRPLRDVLDLSPHFCPVSPLTVGR